QPLRVERKSTEDVAAHELAGGTEVTVPGAVQRIQDSRSQPCPSLCEDTVVLAAAFTKQRARLGSCGECRLEEIEARRWKLSIGVEQQHPRRTRVRDGGCHRTPGCAIRCGVGGTQRRAFP